MAISSNVFGPVVEQAANPGVTDDSDAGFGVGVVWINTATGAIYVSVDSTVDAAVWKELVLGAQEVPMEIMFPLANPIVASANTHLPPAYEYKKPWAAAARRMDAWYVKFESNVGGDVTLKLKKNGTDVADALLTVSSGTSESSVDSFTEFTLAANDVLTVVQTTSRTDAIQAVVSIYGYERIVSNGDTL